MSNSTRQGGYDERLVVPLEASRRGAHRARTNALVAALPLLAVVVVVAAVIGVAYALFLKPGGDATATDPLTSPSSTAPTSAPSQPASQPATSTSPSTSASSSGASSTAPSATVNKNIAITVYNGTSITGLAKSTSNTLVAAGFTKAEVNVSGWKGAPVSQTTVFYAKPEQKATADALVNALGAGKAVSGQTTGGRITVVAFSDLKR